MKILKSYTLIILGCLIVTCSTGPDFKRSNENDPKSTSFNSQISNAEALIDSNKNVHISWYDKSNFEKGFLISKSLGSDSTFIVLDTLPKNSNYFIDTSKSLNKNTFYRIQGFNENINNEKTGTVIPLDFEPLNELNVSSLQNMLTLNVNGKFTFADKYLLEKRLNSHSEWSIIYTLNPNFGSFSFTDNSEAYFIDIKLTTLLIDNSKNIVSVNSTTINRIEYNQPSNFEVDIIDEATSLFSWVDNNTFSDSLIIYERHKEVYNDNYNEFTPLDTITSPSEIRLTRTTNRRRQYAIEAINREFRSGPKMYINKTIYIREPIIRSVEHISNSSFKINWEEADLTCTCSTHSVNTNYLKLFNAENGAELETHVLPRTQQSYTFQNVQSSENYFFSISSFASEESISPTIDLGSDIIDSYKEDYPTQYLMSPKLSIDGSLIYDAVSSLFFFYDINHNNLDLINLEGDLVARKSNLSENNLFLGIYLEENVTDDVLNVNAEVLLINLKNPDIQDQKLSLNFTRNKTEYVLLGVDNEGLVYLAKNKLLEKSAELIQWNPINNKKEILTEIIPEEEEARKILPEFYYDEDAGLFYLFVEDRWNHSIEIYNSKGSKIASIPDLVGPPRSLKKSTLKNSLYLNIYGYIYEIDTSNYSMTTLTHDSFKRVQDVVEVPELEYLVYLLEQDHLIDIHNLSNNQHLFTQPIEVNNEEKITYSSELNKLVVATQYPNILSFDFEDKWIFLEN